MRPTAPPVLCDPASSEAVICAARALYSQVLCLFGTNSVFLDSPLSKRGIEQAQSLRAFVEKVHAAPLRTLHWPQLRGVQEPKQPLSAEAARDRQALRGACLRDAAALRLGPKRPSAACPHWWVGAVATPQPAFGCRGESFSAGGLEPSACHRNGA